jgi:hypothetical protein
MSEEPVAGEMEIPQIFISYRRNDSGEYRDTTVFFRELKMLRDAGYKQKILPNGRILMIPGESK